MYGGTEVGCRTPARVRPTTQAPSWVRDTTWAQIRVLLAERTVLGAPSRLCGFNIFRRTSAATEVLDTTRGQLHGSRVVMSPSNKIKSLINKPPDMPQCICIHLSHGCWEDDLRNRMGRFNP